MYKRKTNPPHLSCPKCQEDRNIVELGRNDRDSRIKALRKLRCLQCRYTFTIPRGVARKLRIDYCVVGTGEGGVEKAKSLGVVSPDTLRRIRRGERNYVRIYNGLNELRTPCPSPLPCPPGRIIVGTGMDGARKAWELGAKYNTIYRIFYGAQNFYIVGGTMDKSEKALLKENYLGSPVKRGFFVVGTGVEAARKAQALGAHRSTCHLIKNGYQDYYMAGGPVTNFERYGKRKELTEENHEIVRAIIERKMHSCSPEEQDHVINQALLCYASIPEVSLTLLKTLAYRYVNWFFLNRFRDAKKRGLTSYEDIGNRHRDDGSFSVIRRQQSHYY